MVGENKQEVLVAVCHKGARGDGVAVAQHHGAAAPYIAQIKLPSAQLLASLHAVDYHACHLTDAAVGIVLHHIVHIFQASVSIVVVETAQTADEDELVAVGTQRESGFRHMCIAEDFFISACLEGVVGG